MKVSRAAACLAGMSLLAAPSLRAQGTIVVRGSAGTAIQVAPGTVLTVPIVVDMTAAGGLNLASLASAMSWGLTRLTLDSVKAAALGTVIPNMSQATNGSASVAIYDVTGTTTTVTAANFYFTALAAGSTKIALLPSVAGSDAGTNLLQRIRVRDIPVCVVNPALWGDVNDDFVVNVIDAQQVARSSVGLSVSNPSAVAARGDVNNDGAANVIDAQQLARYSVSLPAVARIGTSNATPATVANLTVSAVLDAEAGGVNPDVPANTSALAVGKQAQIQALARDGGSVDVTSCAALTYSSNSPGVATVSSTGLIQAVGAGSATITVGAGGPTATVNVTVPATGTQLAVTTQPTGAASGVNLLSQPVVQVRDGSNAVVTGATNPVTATLVGSGGTLGGTTTVSAVNGVATFTNLSVTGPGTYQLTFSAPTLTSATSSSFTIGAAPGAPTKLAVSTAPSSTAASRVAFPQQPVIQVQDANGTLVPGAGVVVTASLSAGAGSLSGSLTATTNSSGVATFTTLSIGGPVGAKSITFSASGLTQVVSNVTLTAGAATTIAINGGDNQTALPSQGVGIAPSVKITDADGNNVAGTSVTFAVASGGGTVTGTPASSNSSGVATVGSWTLGSSNGTNTLTASASGIGSVTFTATASPSAVLAFQSLDASYYNVCGLSSGKVYCWGRSEYGQIGDGTNTMRPRPTQLSGSYTAYGVGYVSACATTVSDVYCWGGSYATSPTLKTGFGAFISVAASNAGNGCGLKSGGVAYCWGTNYQGQVGDGTSQVRATPVLVSGGLTFQSLTLGLDYACGLTTAGDAYCWGVNRYGELGRGGGGSSPVGSNVPTLVVGGRTFTQITAGDSHTCGLTTAGQAFCWGLNVSGQLGIGTNIDATSPTLVSGSLTFSSLAAGSNHTCGISGATTYCWGQNARGQLGDGTQTSRSFPVAVSTALTFTSLTGGLGHTCALTSSGAAYCWGENNGGELGKGANGAALLTPQAVVAP